MDFSAVRINGLPLDSTKVAVTAIIQKFGFHVTSDCVRVSTQNGATSASADVRAKDPSFSRDFSAKVKSRKDSASPFPTIEVQPIPSSVPSAAAGRRVNTTKVHISWHKATRSVWLNFGNGDIAKRVGEKFNKGTYNILGQNVNAGPPKHSSSRGRQGRNPVAWSVMLQNVPYQAMKHDIANSITLEYDKPRHIELVRLDHSFDPSTVPACIGSLLDAIGPHELDLDLDAQTQGKRCKATVRFEEETDARKAVQSLHDKRQSFLNNGKLTLNLVSSARFRVPTNIYDALAEQLSAQGAKWAMRYICFKMYRNSGPCGQFTTLKLEGEQAKEVADAANTLEAILEGKTIEDGGKAVWCESLRKNGDVYQKVKKIPKHLGVLVIRDKSKRRLKFFGPHQLYDQVRQLLVAIVDAEATAGKENEPTSLANPDQDCTICWTEAENPVLTGCKHLYCLECFEDLCKSGGSADQELVIRCHGGMGKCQNIFSLPELQNRLSSAALEGVLEASFTSYVRCHPQSFRYCPTPDCGYVYRLSDTAVMQTCPKCLEVICRACHKQHGVLTCAEYKDLSSGGYEVFEKFKREKGIKDCPTCSTAIEKSDGCDHMTCGGCGTHICWVCLKTFTASEPCYAHMNKVHGSIGLNHLLDF